MERKFNKQPKLHLKVGDNVRIISGKGKGKEGKVLSIDKEKLRAVVEDGKIAIKHIKRSQQNQTGSIVEKFASIHISNLMVLNEAGEARRTGRRLNAQGKLERYFKEHTSLKK
ncbi:MAG: 50S ribosomal protein L24 [Cytophagia bacterium]|nr:MAG: 50S ribosomal protein L24 [Cytophagales bacterium]TAG04840.1 MAG: 50S ribosomal protein L24 [Cytophagia bacterium]TAG43587.1 MAG: 50S ribosomal protein L24 [Cytophagia bacterium]TAH30202.1 MAG: 50S ribosomal protein L24 [Cytophagales bacterium]